MTFTFNGYTITITLTLRKVEQKEKANLTIDPQARKQEVEAIIKTESFKVLQEQARIMRMKRNGATS